MENGPLCYVESSERAPVSDPISFLVQSLLIRRRPCEGNTRKFLGSILVLLHNPDVLKGAAVVRLNFTSLFAYIHVLNVLVDESDEPNDVLLLDLSENREYVWDRDLGGGTTISFSFSK